MKKFVALILGCITICGLYGCSKNSSQIINKTFSLPAYNRIEIDSANDDIKIISGKHYRVRYVGQNKLKPTIKLKMEFWSLIHQKNQQLLIAIFLVARI